MTDQQAAGADDLWRGQAFAEPHHYWVRTFHPMNLAKVRGLGIAVQLMLGVTAACAIWRGWTNAETLRLINSLFSDPTITESDLLEADASVATASGWYLGAYWATGIVFLVWFWRIRKNAGIRDYNPARQRHTQRWSFWGWICPVVNFWFPYQIAVDAFHAESVPGDPHRSKPTLISLWWALFLAAAAVSLIATFLYLRANSVDGVLTAVKFDIFADGIYVIAAVLAIRVVQQLSAMQTKPV